MQNLTIVKVGGAVLEDIASFEDFLKRFNAITRYKILVHGGGRTATQIAARLGIKTKIVDGRRITDREMLQVVTMVYGGLINKNTVAFLQSIECNALGITGADLNLIKAVQRPVGDIDYGLVGDVSYVNTKVLELLLREGFVPVIAPLTHDGKGNLLNTNADTIAASLATAMSMQFNVRLVYSFEKEGVLADTSDSKSVIPLLNRELYSKYRHEGIINAGMLPKLDNSFKALEAGVKEVIITSSKAMNLNHGTRLTL